MALPGNYTVKLIVDGTSYTQPLTLKQDPRLGDSPATIDAMRRQLALSQQIIAVMAASKQAYERGKALGTQLTALSKGSPDKSAHTLQGQLIKLTGTVDEASVGLSGGPYAVPPIKGATSFSRINGQSSALLEMVTSTSESAPVASLYRTYLELCGDFNTSAATWRALQPQVTKLDARLTHTGADRHLMLEAISPLTCKN
ncbi:MAG: hypothetical protein ACRD22_14160 [Terriglobia bacterium]